MTTLTPEMLQQAQYMDEFYMAVGALTNEFLNKYEDLDVRVVILGGLFQHVVGLYRHIEDNPQLDHLTEGLNMTWDFQEKSGPVISSKEAH